MNSRERFFAKSGMRQLAWRGFFEIVDFTNMPELRSSKRGNYFKACGIMKAITTD